MITRRRIKGRLDCGEASATNADGSVLLLLPSLIHLHISHNTQIGAFGKPVLVCSLYLHLHLYIIFAHFVHCIYTLCAFYLHTARTGLVLGGSIVGQVELTKRCGSSIVFVLVFSLVFVFVFVFFYLTLYLYLYLYCVHWISVEQVQCNHGCLTGTN